MSRFLHKVNTAWTTLYSGWNHRSPPDSPHKGQVIVRIFVDFVGSLSKLLNQQLGCGWSQTPWRPYDTVMKGVTWPFLLQWRHNERNGVPNHLRLVCSTVCSGADKKYQSSTSLAFVRGIQIWPVDSPHKGPVMWKMFLFEDLIMLIDLDISGNVSFDLLAKVGLQVKDVFCGRDDDLASDSRGLLAVYVSVNTSLRLFNFLTPPIFKRIFLNQKVRILIKVCSYGSNWQ